MKRMLTLILMKFQLDLRKKCGGNALKGMSGKLLSTVETMEMVVPTVPGKRFLLDLMT